MSAAARAEARRKAILSRGGDRLAKLTTSARGEDGSSYLNTDAPASNSRAFVGDESIMPSPPARKSPSPHLPADAFAAPNVDPSVWSQEQQAQLLQALIGGMPGPGQFPGMAPPIQGDIPPTPPDDPFATMMASLQQQSHPQAQATGKAPSVNAPPSRLQKVMPFVHLGAMWLLLGYFVLYKEPELFQAKAHLTQAVSLQSRWSELIRAPTVAGAWGITLVPFFWAFTTIQIVLHSMRILSGFDAVQPPMLLSLALPHLPPTITSIVVNGMKYMQMASLFLDDIAGLIVGIGFLIFFSNLFTQ
ncbi:hypothetical protein EYR36_011924 [Pleurotus pulmonarius]|nr:hypothetical protein EYR36_011924 [Pleurotus pulmonarius]